MIDWLRSLPIVEAVAFLYVVVLGRAGATYALGRMAHRLARRGRMAQVLDSPRVEAAMELVARRGAPVVALSFLTVGFQTAANAAAGITRMPLRHYLPALAVGGLAWALIYALVGISAVALWLELFLRSPWAAVAVLVAVVALLIALILRPRREGDRSPLRNDDPAARNR
ncbi:VTT domain-containing protein [Brachybacterium sp. EF45031]|uniref:DedA family protein n=1 Tax=Brachybacterium sillae TaxID=2810536 RepID=UPI00217D7BF5|nr:VTT domain-containing protein [Brachybacterium sillae]MCS6710757.1 VTT domain-containing protein [Brachybacterium sillae]